MTLCYGKPGVDKSWSDCEWWVEQLRINPSSGGVNMTASMAPGWSDRDISSTVFPQSVHNIPKHVCEARAEFFMLFFLRQV